MYKTVYLTECDKCKTKFETPQVEMVPEGWAMVRVHGLTPEHWCPSCKAAADAYFDALLGNPTGHDTLMEVMKEPEPLQADPQLVNRHSPAGDTVVMSPKQAEVWDKLPGRVSDIGHELGLKPATAYSRLRTLLNRDLVKQKSDRVWVKR
jgi:hypothetical protein